jgi:hypothetical protein
MTAWRLLEQLDRVFQSRTILHSVRGREPLFRKAARRIKKINVLSHTTVSLSPEREVLKKKEERDEEYALISAGSREELKESVLARVKSVTKASEDVCIALLESNSYDAKTSIEAYFSSS